MNIQEAQETVEILNKINVLWAEREIITAVLYKDYCQRNNLEVPKHIDTLLDTAYKNMTDVVKEEETKIQSKSNINNKDFR